MFKTKIVALDIYGTLIVQDDDDSESAFPPRKGWKDFFCKCGNAEIKVISASDNNLFNLRLNLRRAGIIRENEEIVGRLFYDAIQLKENPKDFRLIISKYNISPLELFVIGDSYEKDIMGAIRIGANYFQVPEYTGYGDNFDLSGIKIP